MNLKNFNLGLITKVRVLIFVFDVELQLNVSFYLK